MAPAACVSHELINLCLSLHSITNQMTWFCLLYIYIYIYIFYVHPYAPLCRFPTKGYTYLIDCKGNSNTFTCDSFTTQNNRGKVHIPYQLHVRPPISYHTSGGFLTTLWSNPSLFHSEWVRCWYTRRLLYSSYDHCTIQSIIV